MYRGTGHRAPPRSDSLLLILLLGWVWSLSAWAHAEIDREFIWTEAPFERAHASTVVETSEGALISAWFGGSGEGNSDVAIWSSRKEPGAPWSPPTVLFKEPGQPAWNPVLFLDQNGVVWLFFKVGPSPREWSGAYIRSRDSGRAWSEVVWLPSGMLGPVRSKPIILSSGAILAGTSFESYKTWSSWMERSEDGGRTWKKYGPIVFPNMEDNRKGSIQPTLLEIEPGVVRAFFRTRSMGKIATAISRDGGRNWSPLRLTELDHPGAAIDAVRLADGRCLLVYNPSALRRSPISVAVSHDSGATWNDFVELERIEEGRRGELSYPSMIQAKDGDVHITYTWNRRRIRYVRIPLADIPGAPARAVAAADSVSPDSVEPRAAEEAEAGRFSGLVGTGVKRAIATFRFLRDIND